jgi:hypothetical protein
MGIVASPDLDAAGDRAPSLSIDCSIPTRLQLESVGAAHRAES